VKIHFSLQSPPSTPLFFCCSVVFYSIFTISSILLRSKFLGLTHSAWFAAIICLHFARHPLLYFLYLSNLLLEHHPCQWLWDFLVFFYPFFLLSFCFLRLAQLELKWIFLSFSWLFFSQQFFIRISMLSCGSFL